MISFSVEKLPTKAIERGGVADHAAHAEETRETPRRPWRSVGGVPGKMRRAGSLSQEF